MAAALSILGLPLTPANPLVPFTDGVLPVNWSPPALPLGSQPPVPATDASVAPSNPPAVIPLPLQQNQPSANVIPQGATPTLLIEKLAESVV